MESKIVLLFLLFHSFMKGRSAAALSARFCLKPTSSSSTPRVVNEQLLRIIPEEVKDHSKTQAVSVVIAETNAKLTRYTQSLTMSPAQ